MSASRANLDSTSTGYGGLRFDSTYRDTSVTLATMEGDGYFNTVWFDLQKTGVLRVFASDGVREYTVSCSSSATRVVTLTAVDQAQSLSAIAAYLATATEDAGTLAASTPKVFKQAWNDAAATYVGLLLDYSGSSANGSTPLAIKFGGSFAFDVDKFGTVHSLNGIYNKQETVAFDVGAASARIYASGAFLSWFGGTGIGLSGAAELLKVRTLNNSGYADAECRNLIQNPAASIVPAVNGEMVFEATSNTTVTVKLKGADGTVRSAALTLS